MQWPVHRRRGFTYDALTFMYDAPITVYYVSRYKFTGKERDNETGLDYFGAWVPHPNLLGWGFSFHNYEPLGAPFARCSRECVNALCGHSRASSASNSSPVCGDILLLRYFTKATYGISPREIPDKYAASIPTST